MAYKKVFCNFDEEEYAAIEEMARKIGMSIPKTVEHAATLYVDMKRTSSPKISEIRKTIESFLVDFNGDSFICSTPFEDWAKMTTSAKRTAASVMKSLLDEGRIVKVDPGNKSHKATVYRKSDK